MAMSIFVICSFFSADTLPHICIMSSSASGLRTGMVNLFPTTVQFSTLPFPMILRRAPLKLHVLGFDVAFNLFLARCESQMQLLLSRLIHPRYHLMSVQHHFSS
ncbi:uncharacterized protein EV420DRAFT_980581 [Desarmillaria tabescens]|uniref:Secreted protein n=1 Tax=Armillaria tabescens TaxID=1929756 RepID=A0AA39MTA5_ARMTA|nr:uncharacterized protein EV420DRAFT_980581 [Desarmillaria tabescens]KAK0445010.1 hypothetical protein EV420DRAFT_980581 [Desarmillaria tabescens]